MTEQPINPTQLKLPNQLIMDIMSVLIMVFSVSLNAIVMLLIWNALRMLWTDLMVLDFKTLFLYNVISLVVFRILPQKLAILSTPIEKEE